MKRYMISPIIGSGTFEDPFRSAVSDLENVGTNSIIPTDQNGQPLYGYAFCCVAAINFAPVAAISNSLLFPDHGLDSAMEAMEAGASADMKQSAEAYDLDGQGLHIDMDFYGDTSSYREVILGIAQQFEPAIANLNGFDAAEPSL